MSLHVNSHTRRHTRVEAGFTILETVIALCIALVLGFGAISLFLFAASFNSGAADRARALAIAQEKMEELRATTYSNLVVADTTVNVTSGSEDVDKSDLRTFSVRTKIENDGTTSPANRQKKVTITVTPAALKGRFTAGGVSLMIVRASDTLGTN